MLKLALSLFRKACFLLLQVTQTVVCALFSLCALAIRLPVLRRAHVIVVLCNFGFGHTVAGPDALRRLYPGRRCVFIALSEYRRHNWTVASIWPDVAMFFLPLTWGLSRTGIFRATPAPFWYKAAAPRVVLAICRRVAGARALVLDLEGFYDRIPIPPGLDQEAVNAGATRSSHVWPMGYFRLQLAAAAPPVHLPAKLRERVNVQLHRHSTQAVRTKMCCLYLRSKGEGSTDLSSALRVGSTLEDYEGALEVLAAAGYQVLLTGDRQLTPSIGERFRGTVMDAARSRVDPGVWQLYAATEADIFIGETGGGTWLPGVNDIPRLILNAYPYFQGYPNSWMFYKPVVLQGRMLHYREILPKNAFQDIPNAAVEKCTRQQITEAVKQFLVEVHMPAEKAAWPEGMFHRTMPDYTWFKQAKSRISPAWLRLFEQEAARGTPSVLSGEAVGERSC